MPLKLLNRGIRYLSTLRQRRRFAGRRIQLLGRVDFANDSRIDCFFRDQIPHPSNRRVLSVESPPDLVDGSQISPNNRYGQNSGSADWADQGGWLNLIVDAL